ncbi:hypothetical protein KSF_001480 [Reticulibacter mediterranei]|uniref:Uncharacterized protein n=1 Tax=Reticulibacter mediterranei TaxID=2778369 RepID=A0A8J3MZD8_9CHLR|nr:hypothetical protein [Reticulibacter mediterranei]GHO90100.1 hypothetical protein KSF_001480 [Reticulibacter mediterranei]
MHLSAVDRLVSTLGPVNALVENLCEHLLPNAVAHASYCAAYDCMDDWGCGVEIGDAHALYCIDYDTGLRIYLHCGC